MRMRGWCRYGSVELDQADIIVALGGDGFMLQTLHATNTLMRLFME